MKSKYLVLALALLAQGASAQQFTAQLAKADGEVTVRRDGGAWELAEAGRNLTEADEIATGVDSTAAVKFSDGTEMQLKELTQIRVGKLAGAAERKKVEIELRVGEVSASVKPRKTVDTNFDIKTPTATASVRGTEIREVSYHPARGTSTELSSGALLVRSVRGNVLSRGADRVRVDVGGRVQPPGELARQRGRVRVEPQGLTRNERNQIARGNQPRPFAPRGTADLARPEGGGPLVMRPPPR
jgi:hypothetical protein